MSEKKGVTAEQALQELNDFVRQSKKEGVLISVDIHKLIRLSFLIFKHLERNPKHKGELYNLNFELVKAINFLIDQAENQGQKAHSN